MMDYTECCIYFCVSFYPKLGAKQASETNTAKSTYVISSYLFPQKQVTTIPRWLQITRSARA